MGRTRNRLRCMELSSEILNLRISSRFCLYTQAGKFLFLCLKSPLKVGCLLLLSPEGFVLGGNVLAKLLLFIS